MLVPHKIAARYWGQPRTIRFRVLSLVTFIVVPLLGLFAWTGMELASTKRALVELHRFDVTHRLSSAIDRDISGIFGILAGLASSDDLRKGRLPDFQRQAAVLSSHPEIVYLWAFSRDGSFVSGSPNTEEQIAGLGLKKELIDDVFNGIRSVSPVQGEGLPNAMVTLAIPVRENGRVIYGLAAQIRIDRLSDLFENAGIEKHWPAAVVDKNGHFVARSLDAQNRVGQASRPELVEAARRADRSGTFENVTYEGVRALNSYYRSDLTGWTSIVAVPKNELTKPIERAVLITLFGGAIVLAGTLFLATQLSKRISGPVANLSRFATALAGGNAYAEENYDIIELDEVRSALERAMASSSRLSALVASSGDAILSMDLDGTIRTWNKGAEELFGYTADEVIGKPKTILIPEEGMEAYRAQRNKILQGDSLREETMRRKKDGTLVHVSLDSAPIRRVSDGRIIAFSSIIHDISDRKAAEKHMQLLMRELAHRCKNQLAIIQVIAGQTARNTNSIEGFLDKFRNRLQGLAKSHDLLTSQNWKGAPLESLVRGQLEAFLESLANQFDIEGPCVYLPAAASESIGLALHELATNASKYGALAVPQGRVSVKWAFEKGSSDETLLRVDWIERGGAKIDQPPTQKGFGSTVIESIVASSVNGKAEVIYHPEGLHWSLEFPVPT